MNINSPSLQPSKQLISEIVEHIDNCRRFRPRITKQQVIDELMHNTRGFVGVIPKDGKMYRKRGCSGPCACTGACEELVPLSELDEMDFKYYAIRLHIVMSAVTQAWKD